jgi:hypothetical protein
MSAKCDFHEIIPVGLVLDGYEIRDAELVIRAGSAAFDDVCPDGGVVRRRFTAAACAHCTISRRMAGG